MYVHPTKVQNPDRRTHGLLQSLPTSETRPFLNFPNPTESGQAEVENLTSGRARDECGAKDGSPAVAGTQRPDPDGGVNWGLGLGEPCFSYFVNFIFLFLSMLLPESPFSKFQRCVVAGHLVGRLKVRQMADSWGGVVDSSCSPVLVLYSDRVWG